MKYLSYTPKNSRAVNMVLLFSLINILLPHNAPTSQTEINTADTEIAPQIDTVIEQEYPKKTLEYHLPKHFPIVPDKKPRKTFYLTVTAYSSTPDQTDSSPFITASGERVRDGIIAYNYLPFGTRVRFPEVFPGKTFIVQDRLREGASVYLADIWMHTREDAKQWGAKVLKIEVL